MLNQQNNRVVVFLCDSETRSSGPHAVAAWKVLFVERLAQPLDILASGASAIG